MAQANTICENLDNHPNVGVALDVITLGGMRNLAKKFPDLSMEISLHTTL